MTVRRNVVTLWPCANIWSNPARAPRVQHIHFSEKAYWLQRDAALKAFVDQWLHIATEDGSFRKIYAAWFD